MLNSLRGGLRWSILLRNGGRCCRWLKTGDCLSWAFHWLIGLWRCLRSDGQLLSLNWVDTLDVLPEEQSEYLHQILSQVLVNLCILAYLLEQPLKFSESLLVVLNICESLGLGHLDELKSLEFENKLQMKVVTQVGQWLLTHWWKTLNCSRVFWTSATMPHLSPTSTLIV